MKNTTKAVLAIAALNIVAAVTTYAASDILNNTNAVASFTALFALIFAGAADIALVGGFVAKKISNYEFGYYYAVVAILNVAAVIGYFSNVTMFVNASMIIFAFDAIASVLFVLMLVSVFSDDIAAFFFRRKATK